MSLRYNPFTGTLDLVGRGGEQLWTKLSETVNAGSTVSVDSITNTDFQALKYVITIYNQANLAFRSLEINILNNNGSYKETRSHRLRSGGLSVSIDVFNNMGTLELRVTNNESYAVQVESARLILS